MIKQIVWVTFFCVMSGCAVVPVTSRPQLALVSQGELLSLSETGYKEILQSAKLSQDSSQLQLVNSVGKKIAEAAEGFLRDNSQAAEIKNYHWEFHVIEDAKQVNAFCMPGGRIVVYTGILPVTQNAEGLAVVLGHEVAHALANHGGERLSQQLIVEMGASSLAKALSSKPEKTQKIWMQAFGAGTAVGVLLPYSRLHETEADRIGLILMARAGFDPQSALGFWDRMSNLKQGAPPEFLSSHPASSRRLESIKQAIPEAMQYYKKS